jgi:hypothetical protein
MSGSLAPWLPLIGHWVAALRRRETRRADKGIDIL